MANKQTIIQKERLARRRFVQLGSALAAGAGYVALAGFSAEAPSPERID